MTCFKQIRGLVPGDAILVTDQTGSLLGEFDERGNRLTTVSLAPYGFQRSIVLTPTSNGRK